MLHRLTILFILCTIANATLSQKNIYTEPSKLLTKLKFHLPQEGVVIFNVLLDNYPDTLNFIFDTGASAAFLDSATAARLNISTGKDIRTVRGMGGIQNIFLSKNHSLKLGDLTEDSLDIYLMDIEIMSYLYGKEIHGIIGLPLQKKYITKINYDKKEISFWSFGKTKFPRSGFYITPNIHNFAYSATQIEDAKKIIFNYMFDSGAALTMLFSSQYVNEKKFLSSDRKKYKKRLQGLGGDIEFDITMIKHVTFGKYRFKNIPVNIFNDENNITSYPLNGGLMGNEILRRFNTVFDYNAKIFHFAPNGNYRDPFDYAYSGLELYLINEKVIVGDVSENSPAEDAGLEHGDEIIAINKQFTIEINKAKKELQSTIGKVNIILSRNDSLQSVEMRTIDIRKNKKR